MPRPANYENLMQLEYAIRTNPGSLPGCLARVLGWPQEKVARGLVSLNDREVLLAEDEEGGLWPLASAGTTD